MPSRLLAVWSENDCLLHLASFAQARACLLQKGAGGEDMGAMGRSRLRGHWDPRFCWNSGLFVHFLPTLSMSQLHTRAGY